MCDCSRPLFSGQDIKVFQDLKDGDLVVVTLPSYSEKYDIGRVRDQLLELREQKNLVCEFLVCASTIEVKLERSES